MNTRFNTTNLNELLSLFYIVNVTDVCPTEAANYLVQTNNISISITGSEMSYELIQAISLDQVDKFRYRYCETPFLLVIFSEEDAEKTALQSELVYIMSVRHYKKLSTVILSEKRLQKYRTTNENLIGYTRPYTKIR